MEKLCKGQDKGLKQENEKLKKRIDDLVRGVGRDREFKREKFRERGFSEEVRNLRQKVDSLTKENLLLKTTNNTTANSRSQKEAELYHQIESMKKQLVHKVTPLNLKIKHSDLTFHSHHWQTSQTFKKKTRP